MEHYPVLIVFLLSSLFIPKWGNWWGYVHCVMSDHSLTSTVWKWVVQDESSSLIALPASAASIKHPGNCSPYVQSSWSHEPGFSVQFISQPFWSTPCLLRTTNPIRTQHPGSSEQILEVISAVQDFFKLNWKYWFIFRGFFFFFVFFFCTKEDFSLIHAEASFLKPAKVASAVEDLKRIAELKKEGVGKGR